MRVILLGAGGMLGQELSATAPPGVELVALRRADLDLTDSNAVVETITRGAPDLIINAAAYTAVDDAETTSELAFRVNADAVGTLTKVAEAVAARLVHFSTDYVFDGALTHPYGEDAPTHPLNVYGRSKEAGETLLASSNAKWLMIRTQWLFGEYGRSFVTTIRSAALSGKPLRVVTDQTGRPTWTRDLARASWGLVQSRALGVFHITNSGTATWYELARVVSDVIGCDVPITPCSSAQFPRPAARPQHAVLSTGKYDRLSGTPMRHWSAALREFLDGYGSR